ncbi:retrovirus-related pol polyprotein from transposon TNT 1-94 [Tanacetum coccineum]|uniref:Retrovirus-related pol polyprotein from transposon TNT 1-94 n=1 Tax=Tanacetum coccineum TaxID=301880 RepID=A0ABQ4XIX4_9ASTR
MLGKEPNKVYDLFLKAELGYKNPERLKKAIAAQPKMYNDELLHSAKLNIDSPDYEETLEVAEKSRLKMRNKMIQINYAKNALYAIFVPQQESSIKQKYFSIPSTSNNSSKSKEEGELPVSKMPNESKLLKIFDKMGVAIHDLRTRIDKTLLEDGHRRWMSDKSFNSVRRPKSKVMKLKNSVLKKTNDKSSSTYVWKMSSSVSIVRILFVFLVVKMCFLLSYEKCVARYALSRNSSVKRALFTTPIAATSKNLRDTSAVAKSRLSVAKIPTATNKVSSVLPLSPDSSDPAHPWIVDSGCSKHMTGNLQLLRKFVEKFMGTVRFRNDHFAAITGYGYYVIGNLTICHVYYVEGLRHNLFSVEEFCDGDLKVAFRSNTCYVWNLEGDDLLTGYGDSNLYTISISKMVASSPVCLMSRATSTKSWLWHRRLSHSNFDTINQLMSKDLVDGLLKFKYNKDHLCSTCEQGKSKKASLPLKLVPSTESKLELLHIDLKMKPKAGIGIFIAYSESSRGFCIYNRQTKKIMETIHVKFDEFTAMASECNNSELRINCMNFQDSLKDSQSVPSKTDLDNLFGPLYEEYYATSSPELLDNSTANTLDNENTSSSSPIVR